MVYKTTSARTNSSSIIKPAELIDFVELTPLKLMDRRIYNLMLAQAWDTISEDKEHVILKSDLLGNSNASNRLDPSIGRLMSSRVRIKIKREGEEYTRSFQLLEHVDEAVKPDGKVYYKFPAKLRVLIQDSTVFARLQKDVMFQLSSKYALCLWEMISKRQNLDYKWSEKFEIAQLRSLLGIPNGKLNLFRNLKARAILPAVQEVDFLSDYNVRFKVNKQGRTPIAITLSWHRKSIEDLKKAMKELKSSRSGRTARMDREVEVK